MGESERMGCAGSTEEGSQGTGEAQVKVAAAEEPPPKKEAKPAAAKPAPKKAPPAKKAEPKKAEPKPKPAPAPAPAPVPAVKLTPPTGEQFWVVIGDKVRFSSYLSGDTTVKDVIAFCNWQLTKFKDKIPKKYTFEDMLVTGLTSPHVISDGLIFCPEDSINELDGWEEEEEEDHPGEHYLIGINEKWKINKGPDGPGYDSCEQMLEPETREAYWPAATSAEWLIEVHETDLKAADIDWKEKAEEAGADLE